MSRMVRMETSTILLMVAQVGSDYWALRLSLVDGEYQIEEKRLRRRHFVFRRGYPTQEQAITAFWEALETITQDDR
jgi:hypothetical protein